MSSSSQMHYQNSHFWASISAKFPIFCTTCYFEVVPSVLLNKSPITFQKIVPKIVSSMFSMFACLGGY
jgi:hypothetical protein